MIDWNAVVVLRTTPSVAKNISRTLMSSSLEKPQKIKSRKRKRSLRAQLIATGADLIPASAQEPEHVGIPFHRHDSATGFTTIEKKLPYSFDQIVEAIFKKFKEPLPGNYQCIEMSDLSHVLIMMLIRSSTTSSREHCH